MTIALGFHCTDGVLICADQQITSPGAFKYHETKISVEEFENFTCVFAYSGLPGLAKEVHDKIASALRSTDVGEHASESVREIADGVLTEMGRLYADLQLQMLIGIISPSAKAELLRFDGKSLHVGVYFNYIGVGDSSLIRFLARKLHFKEIDLKVGMDLGAYLVKKAEDYIDGCGGLIDVVAVGDDYTIKRWSHAVIQDRIRIMERQEAGLSDFLLRKPFSST